MEPNRLQQVEHYPEPPGFHLQLVMRRVDELLPHPSFLKHQIAVHLPKLSALAQRGDSTFREPLAITQDHTILDGYARYEFARQQGRQSLPCFEYALSEEEALQWILATHRQSKGLNDFTRILLALDLEPSLKEKARAHQRAGGEAKGSSKLTEAERLDVRSGIALSAGVSVGNVTKVKQLMGAAQPDLILALRSGEISIHRAWTWCKQTPVVQREALWRYRSERGLNRKIRSLLSSQQAQNSPGSPDFNVLVERLAALQYDELRAIQVVVLDSSRKMICVTKELLSLLDSQVKRAL